MTGSGDPGAGIRGTGVSGAGVSGTGVSGAGTPGGAAALDAATSLNGLKGMSKFLSHQLLVIQLVRRKLALLGHVDDDLDEASVNLLTETLLWPIDSQVQMCELYVI